MNDLELKNTMNSVMNNIMSDISKELDTLLSKILPKCTIKVVNNFVRISYENNYIFTITKEKIVNYINVDCKNPNIEKLGRLLSICLHSDTIIILTKYLGLSVEVFRYFDRFGTLIYSSDIPEYMTLWRK